jgi:hypothetical protein
MTGIVEKLEKEILLNGFKILESRWSITAHFAEKFISYLGKNSLTVCKARFGILKFPKFFTKCNTFLARCRFVPI